MAAHQRPAITRVFRIRAFLPLIAVAMLMAACGGSAPQARTGQPAPAISATTIDGTPVNLADYRGKPVILNFWSSWCGPCREEFPLFEQKLAELGPTDGLEILGVLYKDDPALARTFLDETGAAWPTVADPDGAVADAYRVVAPPQTYFIDADGVVRGMQIGQVREQDFDTQYAKIKP